MLNGTVIVSGRVTDIVSGQPVSNTVVSLLKVNQQYNLIGYVDEFGQTVASDTTDAYGEYSINIIAQNQYAFDIDALSQSPYYIFPRKYDVDQKTKIELLGSHTRDIVLRRTAFAKVNIKNIDYQDTIYSMSIGKILIHGDFWRDTTVYPTLTAGVENEIEFFFYRTGMDTVMRVNPKPWDTVALEFNY